MCFSPQADVVGGVVLTVIGIDALRHVDRRRELLPLALLPIVLAVHQIVEALAWWGLLGVVPAFVGSVAVVVYLVIAFVVLPVYVPAAVVALESAGWRRRVISAFVALGAVVAVVLLAGLVAGPITAEVAGYHLAYDSGVRAGYPIVIAYVVAVCGSLLVSSHRYVRMFGLVNLAVVAVLARYEIEGFVSLWCAWAAVTAGGIALYLRLGSAPGSSRRERTA